MLTDLTDAATTGAVLVTCRYPVPGEDRGLVRVDVPPLSRAELSRLFLRLPALDRLHVEDRRLLARVIGGHPRLIEFVAALYTGKRAPQPETRAKLRDLATAQGVDLTRPRPLHQAVDEALVLGAANVFLDELVGLLTDTQRAALDLLSVCRAPMDVDDLAVALTGQDPPAPDVVARVRGDVEALQDLTLLVPDEEVLAHPWTAKLLAAGLAQDAARPLREAAVSGPAAPFPEREGPLRRSGRPASPPGCPRPVRRRSRGGEAGRADPGRRAGLGGLPGRDRCASLHIRNTRGSPASHAAAASMSANACGSESPRIQTPGFSIFTCASRRYRSIASTLKSSFANRRARSRVCSARPQTSWINTMPGRGASPGRAR